MRVNPLGFILVLLTVSCGTPQNSQTSGAISAPGVGVFADTDHGLVPLSAFGLRLSSTLPVRNRPMSVPSVGSVSRFVINVPNARASEAKIYWIPNLNLIFANNLEPLPTHIESGAHGETTLTCEELGDKKSGYATLVIKMPEGSLDRMYAVALTGKPSSSGN